MRKQRTRQHFIENFGNLKISNMEVVRIYKDMEITYHEFVQALYRLGYHKVPQKEAILYVNDAYGSIISLNPLNTPNRKMLRGSFAAEAYLMEMQGVLEHRDDIAKMIEQERLKALADEKNPSVSAAA